MDWKSKLVKASGNLLIMVFFINMIVQVNLRKLEIPVDERMLYSGIGTAAVIIMGAICLLIQWKCGEQTIGQKLSWLLVFVWILVGLLVWNIAMKTYNLPIVLIYALVSPLAAILGIGLSKMEDS